MFGLFKKKPTATGQPNEALTIVPRIKHTNFLVTLRGIVKNEDDMPVTEPLVGDLLVTYAFDLPETFKMFCGRDLKRLGWSQDELRATAVANLRQQLGEIQWAGEPPVLQAFTGNDLEACVLLLDEVWDSLVSHVPPEILAGVPTRDVLLVGSTKSGESGITTLRESIKTARTGNNTHWLTEHLLVRREGRWVVFEG